MAHSTYKQLQRPLFIFRKSASVILILANILPYTLAFAQEAPPPAPPASTTPATPPPAPAAAPAPAPAPAPTPPPSAPSSFDSDDDGSTPPPPSLLDEVDERLTPVYMQNPLNRAQEPEPSDGSFSYIFPLRIPPGRNGIQPDLTLRYNSGAGKNDDFFGFGWSVSIPFIQRINRKGLETLYVSTSTQYFYSSEDGELATTSDTTTTSFGPKIENGNFRQYTYSTSTGWTVTDKNGIKYKYGTTTAARQDSGSNVYKWMLEEVRDANGNYLYYSYSKDQGQIYPAKVTYTHQATSTGIFEVAFVQTSPASQFASSFATGFSVSTRDKISEIQLKINGSWVTKYALAYTTGDNGQRPLLSTITESGKDENGNELTLPATVFSYQSLQPSQRAWTQDTAWGVSEYFSTGTDDRGVRLGQTNSDGLIDILRNDALGSPDKVYKNNVVSWTDDDGMTIPTWFFEFSEGSIDTGVRVLDVDGDGLIDLIKSKVGTALDAFYLEHRRCGELEAEISKESPAGS